MNQRFLSAMLDMGIPSDKAELALSETGNVGVEARSLPCPPLAPGPPRDTPNSMKSSQTFVMGARDSCIQ